MSSFRKSLKSNSLFLLVFKFFDGISFVHIMKNFCRLLSSTFKNQNTLNIDFVPV